MVLFLVVSLPLFFLLVLWLPWGPRRAPESVEMLSCLFKGALLFFPGFLVMLVVRRIFGFSYGGFLLFLSLLLRDHLAPLLVALGSFLLMKGRLQVSGVEEENFLGVFAFLSGFLAMENLADLVRSWGNWNAYLLFLLPMLRLSAVLLLSLVARRFYPWEGRDVVLFCLVGAALAVGLTVPGFLYHVNRVGWSILLTVLPLLAAVVSFATRFPRVVRA
ncbi:MAG TPA: hypothetical protein VMU36_01865 [Spirochaetia bacterium]|nr:hypothetical protein [Spirochaetia bacterium]